MGSTSSHENGMLEHSPSCPAPVRTGSIPVELPASLAKKMTLNDFKFVKVHGHLCRVVAPLGGTLTDVEKALHERVNISV